jgi:hypothetical protein
LSLFGHPVRIPILRLSRGILGAIALAVQDVRAAMGDESPGGDKVTGAELRLIAHQFGLRMGEVLLSAWGIPVDLDGDGVDGDGDAVPIRRLVTADGVLDLTRPPPPPPPAPAPRPARKRKRKTPALGPASDLVPGDDFDDDPGPVPV